MQWLRRSDIDRFIARTLVVLHFCYMWVFARPLVRVEKHKIRTPLNPSCGVDISIWRRGGGWYFWRASGFHGGFPEDWEPPKSSRLITPAMYIDVLERYLALVSYVERLNTGESEPGTFMLLEDLTPMDGDDIKSTGEYDDNFDHHP